MAKIDIIYCSARQIMRIFEQSELLASVIDVSTSSGCLHDSNTVVRHDSDTQEAAIARHYRMQEFVMTEGRCPI